MQNKILQYLMHLKLSYGNHEAFKILVVKTGVAIYPLLAFQGIEFQKPVGIVADSEMFAKQLFSELAGFAGRQYYSLALKKTQIQAAFLDSENEMISFYFSKGKVCEGNLEYLTALMQLEKDSRCLVTVWFNGVIPEGMAEYLSGVIYLTGDAFKYSVALEKQEDFTRFLIGHIEKNHSNILYEAKKIIDSCVYPDILTGEDAIPLFLVAEIVLKMMFEDFIKRKETIEKLEKSLLEAVKNLCQRFDCLQESDPIWEEQFRHLLYHAAKDIPEIYNRAKIPDSEFEMANELVLFDEKFYYFSDVILRKVCQPWLSTISIVEVKNNLCDAGVILAEKNSRQSFSPKITVTAQDGRAKSIRKIKIFREKIDMVGNLTWREMVLVKEENNNRTIELGKTAGIRAKVTTVPNPMNWHFLITGISGSGKTVALQKIEKRIAANGGCVIVLNYGATHNWDKEDEKMTVHHSVRKQGMPFHILQPIPASDGEYEEKMDIVENILQVLDKIRHLGVRQKMALREIIGLAIENASPGHEMEVLTKQFADVENPECENTAEQFRILFSRIKDCQKELDIQPGKIYDIDFWGYDSSTQSVLAELILAWMWRYAKLHGHEKEQEIFVACDEFQNLGYGTKSTIAEILREGRRCKLSLLLATQTLAGIGQDSKDILAQVGTRLFFKPSGEEVSSVSKFICPEKPDVMRNLLQELQVGECIAQGKFCAGNISIDRALKLRF